MSTETFTDEEQRALQPYFTNTDRPVFALTNLPETVKGALFARYSRSAKSVRRLFLDEFVGVARSVGPTKSKACGSRRPTGIGHLISPRWVLVRGANSRVTAKVPALNFDQTSIAVSASLSVRLSLGAAV